MRDCKFIVADQCFFFAQATFVHVQKVPKNFLHRKIFFVPSKNVFFGM